MKSFWKGWVRDESGQVLVLFALLLTVIFGFAALAIDVGGMVVTKSQVQNAADAAALAGAQDLTNTAKAKETAIDYAEKNGVIISSDNVETPYDGDATKIKVECTRDYSYMFARVFPGFDKKTISASAVAQNSQWAGDALPFLNVVDYSETTKVLWEKESDGFFSCIHRNDYEVNDTATEISFSVNWSDGLAIENGKVAKKADELERLYQQKKGKIVYLISLSKDVINSESKSVEFTDGSTLTISTLNQIPNDGSKQVKKHQLVLLECIFDDYRGQGNGNKVLELTLTGNVWDIGNDELPPVGSGSSDN